MLTIEQAYRPIAVWALRTAIAAFIIHVIRTLALFAPQITSRPVRGEVSNHERNGDVRPSIPQGERTK